MAPRKNATTESIDEALGIGTAVVGTRDLNQDLNTKVNELERTRREVNEMYKQETKVIVQGSPMYRPYFGNNMPISINGIAIFVPLDGQQYRIPESFAAVFHERISRVDEQIRVRTQMANVSQNAEKYAGEKNLISIV